MGLARIIPLLVLFISLSVGTLFAEMTETEFREGFAVLARLGSNKPFLKDSPDVYLEPQSLNLFFTDRIYQRLEGNSYFGYRWNEGFSICSERSISIEDVKDLTNSAGAAYRRALELSLNAEKYQIVKDSNCRIGIAVVGVETAETERTLPGILIEAYFLNASTKKSFFIRFGVGSPRGLAGAIQLSAEMLVAELEAFRGR
jgi:hypothetical protein